MYVILLDVLGLSVWLFTVINIGLNVELPVMFKCVTPFVDWFGNGGLLWLTDPTLILFPTGIYYLTLELSSLEIYDPDLILELPVYFPLDLLSKLFLLSDLFRSLSFSESFYSNTAWNLSLKIRS